MPTWPYYCWPVYINPKMKLCMICLMNIVDGQYFGQLCLRKHFYISTKSFVLMMCSPDEAKEMMTNSHQLETFGKNGLNGFPHSTILLILLLWMSNYWDFMVVVNFASTFHRSQRDMV
ncbi:uncharacterized protein LOC118740483 [Rhagoletis pomonella]|uniref:uncharacterized protein LOC118740483 n=1 Tax=Rhagoletis pomonella TaxID=28610 RepID=UPI001783E52B|nr:uncharacterized protein LOC118740483 [Rhagoletis pomonella]